MHFGGRCQRCLNRPHCQPSRMTPPPRASTDVVSLALFHEGGAAHSRKQFPAVRWNSFQDRRAVLMCGCGEECACGCELPVHLPAAMDSTCRSYCCWLHTGLEWAGHTDFCDRGFGADVQERASTVVRAVLGIVACVVMQFSWLRDNYGLRASLLCTFSRRRRWAEPDFVEHGHRG